jgi:sugar lactone lactonase YvrE
MRRIIIPVIVSIVCCMAACKKNKHEQQLKAIVSTVAGNGIRGFADGPVASAQFSDVAQLAIDAQGNIYVADPNNNRIRKITPAGMVSTLAGNGTSGFVNGPGATAQFNRPCGVACDANGNVFVSDWGNNCIRKITPSGDVSLFAGTGVAGSADGPGASAQFYYPVFIACDANGNIYVADQGNSKIRKITPSGIVSTYAGSGLSGTNDGPAAVATFAVPTGVACDAHGNVYVADLVSSRVRKITPAGVVSTLAGSSNGLVEGTGIAAQFHAPTGIVCDAQGNLYVTDQSNHRVRKITPNAAVTTFAGTSSGFLDGEGTAAQFRYPQGIAMHQGVVYVGDAQNYRIRKITLQ